MIKQLILDISTGFCQEAFLIAAIFLYLITATFFGKHFYKASKWVVIAILAGTVFSSLKVQIFPAYYSFNGAFVSNIGTVFIKTMILICSFFVILLSKNVVLKRRHKVFDFFILVLFGTLGAICLVSSNDFTTMFVAFELLGISSYLLTSFTKSQKTNEVGLKHFITGGVASAIMLLGISFIYMAMGSLNFDIIYSILREVEEVSPLFNIGCVLCVLGLTSKLGLIPFSNWLPDTFEETSNNVAAFISLVPIFAGLGILSKLIIYIFQYTPMVQALLFAIGILSIFKGFLGAIRQDNIKRFLGFTTISQAGFMILGFSLSDKYSASTSIFYMFTYIFMTVGVWAAVIMFKNITGKITIPDLRGLVYSNKIFSLMWIICLLSLSGLPVTAGFLAKIYLFLAIAKSSNLYLVFLGLIMLGTVLGVYAYFRPIKEMFYKSDNNFFFHPKFNAAKLTLFICTAITILICIFPDKIIQICQNIAYNL